MVNNYDSHVMYIFHFICCVKFEIGFKEMGLTENIDQVRPQCVLLQDSRGTETYSAIYPCKILRAEFWRFRVKLAKSGFRIPGLKEIIIIIIDVPFIRVGSGITCFC